MVRLRSIKRENMRRTNSQCCKKTAQGLQTFSQLLISSFKGLPVLGESAKNKNGLIDAP
jgi:hypothetical protein